MNSMLRMLLGMIIGLANSQGVAMENDSDPKNDMIGEGLVFISHFAQFLLDKSAGKNVAPPPVPKSLHQ